MKGALRFDTFLFKLWTTMNIFRLSSNFFWTCLSIVLFSCQASIQKKIDAQQSDFCNRYIFNLNYDYSTYAKLKEKKIHVYFDSLLTYREDIFYNHRKQYTNKTHSNLLLDTYPKHSLPLLIPDSLKEVFKYRVPGIDPYYGTSNYYWYSPLLPTKKKKVYVIQYYWIGTMGYENDESSLMRVTLRNYHVFKVKRNGKITYLKTIDDPEDFAAGQVKATLKN